VRGKVIWRRGKDEVRELGKVKVGMKREEAGERKGSVERRSERESHAFEFCQICRTTWLGGVVVIGVGLVINMSRVQLPLAQRWRFIKSSILFLT